MNKNIISNIIIFIISLLIVDIIGTIMDINKLTFFKRLVMNDLNGLVVEIHLIPVIISALIVKTYSYLLKNKIRSS